MKFSNMSRLIEFTTIYDPQNPIQISTERYFGILGSLWSFETGPTELITFTKGMSTNRHKHRARLIELVAIKSQLTDRNRTDNERNLNYVLPCPIGQFAKQTRYEGRPRSRIPSHCFSWVRTVFGE